MLKKFWWQLIRLGFRLLYNEMAWTYDAVSWLVSLGEWRAWQQAALPHLADGRVLEIAHGPGHMLLALARQGQEVVGLDLSPYMGRQAQRRLQKNNLPVRLVRGEVQALPFATASFNSVLSTFPTAFIAESETIWSVYRLLRPGGRFVIVPEGHLTGQGRLHRFLTWLYVITGQRDGAFAVDQQEYWPDESSPLWQTLRQQMERAGFRLQVERVSLERSGVTVVVAHKEDVKTAGC